MSPAEQGERISEGFGGVFSRLTGCFPDESVEAVESHPQSAALGEVNARANGCGNVHFHAQRVEAWLAAHSERSPDLVLLDPPRAGAGAAVVTRVAELAPRTIRYVSRKSFGTLATVKIAIGNIVEHQVFNVRCRNQSIYNVVKLKYWGNRSGDWGGASFHVASLFECERPRSLGGG